MFLLNHFWRISFIFTFFQFCGILICYWFPRLPVCRKPNSLFLGSESHWFSFGCHSSTLITQTLCILTIFCTLCSHIKSILHYSSNFIFWAWKMLESLGACFQFLFLSVRHVWVWEMSVEEWLENLCSEMLKPFMAQRFPRRCCHFLPCPFWPTGTMSTSVGWLTGWKKEVSFWEVIIFLWNGGAEKSTGSCKHWKGISLACWRRTRRESRCLALCHGSWWRQSKPSFRLKVNNHFLKQKMTLSRQLTWTNKRMREK